MPYYDENETPQTLARKKALNDLETETGRLENFMRACFEAGRDANVAIPFAFAANDAIREYEAKRRAEIG